MGKKEIEEVNLPLTLHPSIRNDGGVVSKKVRKKGADVNMYEHV